MILTTDELEHPECGEVLASLHQQLSNLQASGAESGILYYRLVDYRKLETRSLFWTEEITWEKLKQIIPKKTLNIHGPVWAE